MSYDGEVHSTVTEGRLMDLIESQHTSLDNPGVCLSCGADHDACEPDAQGYTCYECSRPHVYGAEQIFMGGGYHS